MDRNIIIVDENDREIGVKPRGKVRPEDIYRVSALWITNSRGDILLARRALTKAHDPGKWGPAVAGTVDEGETYLDNIIKEAEEELGLSGIVPLPGSKERHTGPHNYFVQRYSLALDRDAADFRIKKDEVAEVRWFPRAELEQKLIEHPDDFLKSVRRWKDWV